MRTSIEIGSYDVAMGEQDYLEKFQGLQHRIKQTAELLNEKQVDEETKPESMEVGEVQLF